MTLGKFLKRIVDTVCVTEEEMEAGGAGDGEPPDPQHQHHHYLHQCGCHHYRVSRWDNPDNINLHWTVRATAYIATFFKAISICLAVLAVLALSYLGIMISWGLAFGLPWILAYFYFVWICPAHQVSMGIRKLKPHRMLWFVVSTLVHILISTVLLISWTVPKSWPSLDFGKDHQLTFGLGLCLFLSLLLTFEVIIIHAILVIWRERKRLQTSDHNTCSLLDSLGNFGSSPPPSYQEVYTERDQPPNYEDVVKEDSERQNLQMQNDSDENEDNDNLEEETIENAEQDANDCLEQNTNTNEDMSENPAVEIES